MITLPHYIQQFIIHSFRYCPHLIDSKITHTYIKYSSNYCPIDFLVNAFIYALHLHGIIICL